MLKSDDTKLLLTKSKKEEYYYVLTVICKEIKEETVRSFLVEHLDSSNKYLLRSIARKSAESSNEIILKIKFSTVGRQEVMLESIIKELISGMGIDRASWAYADEESAIR